MRYHQIPLCGLWASFHCYWRAVCKCFSLPLSWQSTMLSTAWIFVHLMGKKWCLSVVLSGRLNILSYLFVRASLAFLYLTHFSSLLSEAVFKNVRVANLCGMSNVFPYCVVSATWGQPSLSPCSLAPSVWVSADFLLDSCTSGLYLWSLGACGFYVFLSSFLKSILQ